MYTLQKSHAWPDGIDKEIGNRKLSGTYIQRYKPISMFVSLGLLVSVCLECGYMGELTGVCVCVLVSNYRAKCADVLITRCRLGAFLLSQNVSLTCSVHSFFLHRLSRSYLQPTTYKCVHDHFDSIYDSQIIINMFDDT